MLTLVCKKYFKTMFLHITRHVEHADDTLFGKITQL